MKLLKTIVHLILGLSFIACLLCLAGAAIALLISVLSVLGVRNGKPEFTAVVMFFLFAVVCGLLAFGCSSLMDRLKKKIEENPDGTGRFGWLVWVFLIAVIIVLALAFLSPSLSSPISVP